MVAPDGKKLDRGPGGLGGSGGLGEPGVPWFAQVDQPQRQLPAEATPIHNGSCKLLMCSFSMIVTCLCMYIIYLYISHFMVFSMEAGKPWIAVIDDELVCSCAHLLWRGPL